MRADDDPGDQTKTTHEDGARPGPRSPHEIELAHLRAATRAKLFGRQVEPTTVGRYRIIERLGAGGMGVVYLAHDDELDRRVAVKVLRANTWESSQGQSRLLREARAMAKLSHPNVAHVYEVKREDPIVFIAMEYIDGENLRQWAAAGRSVSEVLSVHGQAGRGLAAAHAAGLVHRDYKPENVMVEHTDRVRVLDFGLARPDGPSAQSHEDIELTEPTTAAWDRLTETGTVLGTPAYMAPEQFVGRVADARADQFAFCVTVFEALYADRPFGGATMAELSAAVLGGEIRPVNPEHFGVPSRVHQALLRGLSTRPEDRHASMDALLDALDSTRSKKTSRRWWIPAALLGVAAVAGLLLLGPTPTPSDPATAQDANEPAAPGTDPYAQILAASHLPDLLPEPLPDDPNRVTIHRLANGLTIYIAPDHDAPLLTAAIVVRGGSAHEPPGANGVARLLERMMFTGTARLGALDYPAEEPLLEQRNALARELEDTRDPEQRREQLQQLQDLARQAAKSVVPFEYASVIESIGGQEPDASVSPLATVFRADIPSARLTTWAALEAERMRNPVFRGFFAALGVIAEKLAVQSSTLTALQQQLLAPSAYAHSAGGSLHDLVRPPFSAMVEFHRQHYVPNNMAVVLVGDVDANTALPILEGAFGSWPPSPVESRPAFPSPLPPGRRELVVPKADPWPLALGWRMVDDTPEGISNTEHALEVIEHEVDAALTEAGLTMSTTLIPYQSMIIAVFSRSAQASIDAVESAFFDALHTIRRDGPRTETLTTIQAQLTRSSITARRSTWHRVHEIAKSYQFGWSWPQTVRAAHAPLDPAMIEQTLDHLLGTGFIATRHGDPPKDIERPSIPAIDAVGHASTNRSAYARELLAIPAASIEPQFVLDGRHYQTSAFDQGIEIAADVDDGLTELELIYPVGTLEDPWVCPAIDLWRHSGIESRTRQELYDEWSRPGVSIDGWCSHTHSGISVTVLDEHLDEAWPSLVQWLSHPRPRPEDLERVRQLSLSKQRNAVGSPLSALQAVRAYALHGPQSRFHLGPEPAALTAMTLPRLSKALDSLRATRPFILYAGSSRRPSMSDLPPSAAPPMTPVQLPPRTEPRLVALDDGTTDRAFVTIMLTRSPLARQDQILADLLQVYLTESTNGLLGDELRLASALIYSLEASFTAPTSPLDDAQLYIKLGVAPNQVLRVIDIIRSSIRDAIEPERLRTAQDRLETQYRTRRIPPPQVPRKVFRWHQAGLDDDPLLAKWTALPTVTPAQLDAFKDSLLVQAPIITILGDLNRIGRPALERLGDFEEVTRDDIFAASPSSPPSPGGAP